MLAPKPSHVHPARPHRQQITGLSYELPAAPGSQSCMVIANTFILWVLGAAAFMAVAAVVQKRTRRDRDVAERSTNHAS